MIVRLPSHLILKKEQSTFAKNGKSHLRTPKKKDDTNLTHTCVTNDRRELCKEKTC